MQATRWNKLIHLWLAATLVVLVGTGIVLRPDREVVQYAKHQDVGIYPSDLQARQLITHLRLLRRTGLAFDEIKERLLSTGSPTNEAWIRVVKHQAAIRAKRQAEERLALFVAIALVLPLTVLEFGAVFFWMRRGYGMLLNSRRLGAR